MADQKISQFTAATSLLNSDLFVLARGSGNRKLTWQLLKSEFISQTGMLTGSLTTNRIPLAASASSLTNSYLLQDANGVLVDNNKKISGSGGVHYINFGADDRVEIFSTNSFKGIYLDSTDLSLRHNGTLTLTTGALNERIVLTPSSLTLNHNTLINLGSGSQRPAFPGLTATTVPYIDASQQIASSAVTPTELGYLSGVTSAIQTQLNNKYTTLYFACTQFNPADSTTYYIGLAILAPSTTQTDQDFQLGFNGTVVGAVIQISNATTAGSAELATFSLRNVTQATSSVLGTSSTNFSSPVAGTAMFTGLNISVAATDSIAIQFATPAYATNPAATVIRGYLIIRPT